MTACKNTDIRKGKETLGMGSRRAMVEMATLQQKKVHVCRDDLASHVNSPQEYDLARTHCYGRYLHSIGLGEVDKEEEEEEEEEEEKWREKVAGYFQRVEEQGLIVAAVSLA